MEKHQAQLIALDWGTSSLRCYRIGALGKVLETRSFPLGIAQILGTAPETSRSDARQVFEKVFLDVVGDWIDVGPGVALIACGMVGSASGWCEIPYLEIPIDCRRLGDTLCAVRISSDRVLHIVPGLIERTDLPNVMRGEETQIVGALIASSGHFAAGKDEVLVGLPGTHSKWAFMRGSTIEHFETFMTGEVYRALCAHTILGRTMRQSPSVDYDSFDRGVHVTQEFTGEAGILSTIFSVRTLWLVGDLSPEQQPDYLSGLIIGHEIAALLRLEQNRRRSESTKLSRILLVGESALVARYARALGIYGRVEVKLIPQATERGLWFLADQAGLVPRTDRTHSHNYED
jgi:2-dehydro-3-deoxygalactonokinase